MQRDPETFEIFPAGSESRVLLAGFCGALFGAIVFGFCAGLVSGLLNMFYLAHPWPILILLPMFGAICAIVLYCTFGPIFFLIGFFFSHLTGHAVDLRALALAKASATVYLPFSYFMFVSVHRAPGSGFSYSSEDVFLVLVVLLPAMTFVSIGAWSWAHSELEKSFTQNASSTRRFGLRTLFVATFLIAMLLFVSKFFSISILFWVGYVVLLVPVSLLTACFVWARRFLARNLGWKTVSDSPEEPTNAHSESPQNEAP